MQNVNEAENLCAAQSDSLKTCLCVHVNKLPLPHLDSGQGTFPPQQGGLS